MANIGKGRALQVCDACGGVDDHPRHVIAGSAGAITGTPTPEIIRKVMTSAPDEDSDRLIADLLDTGSLTLHRDCCRDQGCPTGECATLLEGWNGKPGAAMLNHIMKGA
jgi:hypothetical protein